MSGSGTVIYQSKPNTGGWGTGYAAGQCTDYVASQIGWLKSAYPLGNAGNWLKNWLGAGHAAASIPIIGMPTVFQGGADGSDANSGHVAITTNIHPDGTFDVIEANFRGDGVVDARTNLSPGPNVHWLLPPGQGPSGQILQNTGGLDLNPVDVVGNAISGAISPIVTTLINVAEIALGAALAIAGIVLLAIQTKPGKAALGGVSNAPGPLGTAAKAASAGVGAAGRKAASEGRERARAGEREEQRLEAANRRAHAGVQEQSRLQRARISQSEGRAKRRASATQRRRIDQMVGQSRAQREEHERTRSARAAQVPF